VNALGTILWTIAIVLPFAPFSYLEPIMVGGGPGTWFLVGYLLYPTIGVGGFASIASFLFMIETYERRNLNHGILMTGFALLFVGVLTGCVLLGVAGAISGYALVIQQSTVNVTQNLLSPYVDPITAASLVAVAGAGVLIYGMATAKATKT
jgi:hypothetical protein